MRCVFEKVEGTIDGKVLRDSDERGIEGVWVWGVEGIVYGNGLKLSDVLLDVRLNVRPALLHPKTHTQAPLQDTHRLPTTLSCGDLLLARDLDATATAL